MDKIFINGLSVFSLIGVYDWERESKTQLYVDVVLDIDLSRAAQSDDVADTVDYAAVAKALEMVAEQSEFELLEALANAMVNQLFASYPVLKVSLKISKPGILPNAQNVAIQLNREV